MIEQKYMEHDVVAVNFGKGKILRDCIVLAAAIIANTTVKYDLSVPTEGGRTQVNGVDQSVIVDNDFDQAIKVDEPPADPPQTTEIPGDGEATGVDTPPDDNEAQAPVQSDPPSVPGDAEDTPQGQQTANPLPADPLPGQDSV